MEKKGQTAIETTFVVLFILLAISAILANAVNYGHNIEFMASARAAAQGFAMKLTMEGTLTHLVRIDLTDDGMVNIYAMSEDCSTKATLSGFDDYFKDVLDLDYTTVKEVVCRETLYSDKLQT